jgi:hypothetical protein
MEESVRSVRHYKKTPVIAVPETPDYLKHHLPTASSSSLPPSPNDLEQASPTMLLSPLLASPFDMLGWTGGSSSQPRLIQSPLSDAKKLVSKFERMELLLKDSGFDSVGDLLNILFYNPSRASGESDPRGSCHAKAVSRFLQGRNKIKMSDIITLIYEHKHSAPLRKLLRGLARALLRDRQWIYTQEIDHARRSRWL